MLRARSRLLDTRSTDADVAPAGPTFIGASRTGRRKACSRFPGSASPAPHRGARTARQRRPQPRSSSPHSSAFAPSSPLAAAAGPRGSRRCANRFSYGRPGRRREEGPAGATDGCPAELWIDSSLEPVRKCGRVAVLPDDIGGLGAASGRALRPLRVSPTLHVRLLLVRCAPRRSQMAGQRSWAAC
jgi:hypothetical protein